MRGRRDNKTFTGFALFTSMWKKSTAVPANPALICPSAKRELEALIEGLLLTRYDQNGAISLLDPELRVVAIGEQITLATAVVTDAICDVKLRALPSIMAFLVVRDNDLAVPRDVVANIATEAAREIAKRINALV